jgi:transposase InsO family protein
MGAADLCAAAADRGGKKGGLIYKRWYFGIQYCADSYQALHAQHGLTCSMTDGYDCYQNALAERINGILKTEFQLCRPENLARARCMVRQSVEIYNRERPHLALQYKTPCALHRAFDSSLNSHPCPATVNL